MISSCNQIEVSKSKILDSQNKTVPQLGKTGNILWTDEMHMDRKYMLNLGKDEWPVQFSHSVLSDSATSWITTCQASLSIANSQSSLKLMSKKSVMPSSHLVLCCPLLLLPPIPPSTRVFSNRSTLLMRWPKYWSFSFSISPSSEHPGLISFRMHWLDLLAVQGTLKSLLQHHSSKASMSGQWEPYRRIPSRDMWKKWSEIMRQVLIWKESAFSS